MPMDFQTHLDLMDRMIQRMQADLEKYCEKLNANPKYIELKNQEIDAMIDFWNASKAMYEGKEPTLPRLFDDMGKKQPQDIELETAVLGALMLERGAIDVVINILLKEDFYKEAHQHIYHAMLMLYPDPIDLLTVTDKLRKIGRLEEVGGHVYIAQLTDQVSSAANIEYYARIMKEKAMLRRYLEITYEGQKKAYDETTDVFVLLEDTNFQLSEILPKLVGKALKRSSQLKTI